MSTEKDQKKALNKTDVMRWVSINEKLPNIGQSVIIYDGISVKDFYYYNNLGQFREFNHTDGIQLYNKNVTHWMPLPSAPIA